MFFGILAKLSVAVLLLLSTATHSKAVNADFVVMALAAFLRVGVLSHVINQPANRLSRLCNLTSI